MGCISSKGMSRSMSIQERFSQGVHALAIVVLPGDDFNMTARERDRFITLIKIASGKNLRGFRYVEDDTDETTLCTTKPCMGLVSTELPESESDGTDQVSGRCRSFHTLEELDELIEKINLFEAKMVDNGFESETETRDSSEKSPLSKDDEMIRPSLDKDNIPSPKNLDAAGWKRKTMARELQSLMLPISGKAELSTVNSLKEWVVHVGADIYSPESYMTPKFGSYATERKDSAVFSPELVAAFEECMQQMEEEELAIVKEMEESLENNAST